MSNGWEDVEIQDVDFQQVALSAPLVDASGAVTVAVLLAEENGELVYGNDAADCGQEGTDPCKNEVTSIAEGALKFTVTIENVSISTWPLRWLALTRHLHYSGSSATAIKHTRRRSTTARTPEMERTLISRSNSRARIK